MFEQLEKYKNHYLQKFLPWMKAGDINALEQKDLKFYQRKRYVCRQKKCCPTEDCSHSTYLEDHAKLAYGWFALPKLLRELNSDDIDERWRAINSLSEFLLNPYHCQRAINEFSVVRRVQNVFLRFRQNLIKAKHQEVKKLLRIFYVLSIHLNGAEDMSRHHHLLNELYTMIYNDEKEYKEDVAKILRNMTEKPEVQFYMVFSTNALQHVVRILHKDWCILDYPKLFWKHLTQLFELAPDVGVQNRLLDVFAYRIIYQIGEYWGLNMYCFGQLLRCKKGQEWFLNSDGLKMIYNVMTKHKLSTYENVCFVLMNAFYCKKVLWRAREFPNIPDIVTGYAKLAENGNFQITALKTLRLLADMPLMKRNINEICRCEIEQLVTRSSVVDCERARLLCFLAREKWDSDSPVAPLEQL